MRTWLMLLLAAGVTAIAVTAWIGAGPPASQPTIAASAPSTSQLVALSETEKIERLIKSVADLKGAVFIRNGKEYDCAAAAKHMRDKWEWKTKEIATARDFIRIAASKSSTSGEPYLIKFNDGKQVTSADYLTALLKKLENPPAQSQPTTRPKRAG